MNSPSGGVDYDWLVIGSGFGGSVSALRLAEKGYRVGVLEQGRRYRDEEYAASTWQLRRWLWAPLLGLRGIFQLTPFKDVFIASGTAVGGGSTVYANTLYRASPEFFVNPQWRELNDWAAALQPHYDTAERMLGVVEVPRDSDGQQLLREVGRQFGVEDTFRRTPVGVYFGKAGTTVPDPYFGGEGIMPEREVVDIRPIGAQDGSEGYVVTTERPGAWFRKQRRSYTARGIVMSAGALGTNRLLAKCKLGGSLPHISDRLGQLVRTNSESILAVTLPEGMARPWNDVAISSSIHTSPDTHIEFVTYGKHGDTMALLYTLLTGNGSRVTRPLLWLGNVLRHPVTFLKTLWPVGWARRTVIFLVMQTLDNAISFRARRGLFGGVSLITEQDPEKPNPTFIEAGNRAAQWLAQKTGGYAQSMLLEAWANIPTTAHILGGAVLGRDAGTGVVDQHSRLFGYRNFLVCDGSTVPANPGVNPSLTITAMSEYAMSQVAAHQVR